MGVGLEVWVYAPLLSKKVLVGSFSDTLPSIVHFRFEGKSISSTRGNEHSLALH